MKYIFKNWYQTPIIINQGLVYYDTGISHDYKKKQYAPEVKKKMK